MALPLPGSRLPLLVVAPVCMVGLTAVCSGTATRPDGADAARTRSPVVLTIDTSRQGPSISPDFIGLSFETGSLRKGNAGVQGYLFDPDNQQALNLFRQLGVRSLRIGGGSVDTNLVEPSPADIDAFFAFVKAADARVIYSLRLLNGSVPNDVAVAEHIWRNHRERLDCFAIGNEPDWKSYHTQDPEITGYPSYLAKWRRFASAVHDAVPGARFCGPDTGSNYPVPGATDTYYDGRSWTVRFAADEAPSGLVPCATQHNYVGQDATRRSASEMIDGMLSADWVRIHYPALYDANLAPVLAIGVPYRLTESNSFSGQVDGASNSFATALFGLDYLHWWAERSCLSVNFHNKQWVKNAPLYLDGNGGLQVNPLGYGIAAFNLGGHGSVQPVTVSNPNGVNLTAYAVRDTDGVTVTVINKEHGRSAHDADVTVNLPGSVGTASVVTLAAPGNDVAALSGVTLGGATIRNDSAWQGLWSPVKGDAAGYALSVAAGSAAIVKLFIR